MRVRDFFAALRRLLFFRLTFLEAENERLRSELRQWQDIVLAEKGLPTLTPRDATPFPLTKKRMLPSQFRKEAERFTMPKEKSKSEVLVNEAIT